MKTSRTFAAAAVATILAVMSAVFFLASRMHECNPMDAKVSAKLFAEARNQLLHQLFDMDMLNIEEGAFASYKECGLPYIFNGLKSHKWHHRWTKEWEDGQVPGFVFVCTRNIAALHRLPKRSPRSPYVVPAHGTNLDTCELVPPEMLRSDVDQTEVVGLTPEALSDCRLWYRLFTSDREDFLFMMPDLRDFRLCDDEFPPLPGVAIPPNKPSQEVMEITDVPDKIRHAVAAELALGAKQKKYEFSFIGTNHGGYYGASTARPDLFEAHAKWKQQLDLQLGLGDHRRTCQHAANEVLVTDAKMNSSEAYFSAMLDSNFALIVHGDGRWNFRLQEVLAVSTIPAFLTAGVTMPFQQLVNWTMVSTNLDEKEDSKSIPQVLKRLCEITSEQREQMRYAVAAVYTQCFATETAVANCLVRSLLAASKQNRLGRMRGLANSLMKKQCPSPYDYHPDRKTHGTMKL